MNNQNLNKLISDALAIEARDAKEAGALGFMARALVQATIPHSKVEGNEFKRRNGAFKLTILADSEIGLPYGSLPRMLIAWLTTEAVKTKQRELILGDSLSKFMQQLGLIPTGGRWGTIARLREQMKRLFSAAISCTYDDGKHWAIRDVKPVSNANLWWNPKSPDQIALYRSTLTLGEEFFNEAINFPVPIDIRVLKALSKSPLSIDIYVWLTYRMSYLRNEITIPWEALQIQFGANYAMTPQGVRDFKRAFLRELRKVDVIYGGVKLDSQNEGLVLCPSKSHIPFLKINQ